MAWTKPQDAPILTLLHKLAELQKVLIELRARQQVARLDAQIRMDKCGNAEQRAKIRRKLWRG